MIAYFNRFTITMTLDQARNASHPGPCAADVEYLAALPAIRRQLAKIPADTLRDELREVGAWDREELADDEENRLRIVWMAAGNIREEAAMKGRR